MSDIRVSNLGTIVQFHGVSEAGRAWMDENVQAEGWQWLGSWLSVDHRFAGELIEGMQGAGLELEVN